METEANVGYQDAMRQVQRAVMRRMKTLEDALHDAKSEDRAELAARIDELHRIVKIVESLHR